MSIKVRERDVESYLVEELKKRGVACVKFIPDSKIGMPDRMVLLPDQRVLWVELKTDNGRLEEIQKLQHKRLRDIGHKVVVVWSKEDVDKLLEQI
jgi:hypothetical protein